MGGLHCCTDWGHWTLDWAMDWTVDWIVNWNVNSYLAGWNYLT
jgi:hypothetical protein